MTEQAIREIAKSLKSRGRCPSCHLAGNIRTRIKTRDRVCRVCGYIGDPGQF